MIDGTVENFDELIHNNSIVLIDWFALWCQPCQRMLKILPNLEAEFGDKVVFIKVDVDENRSLADTFHVKIIPTFFIFKDGIQVEKWEGIKTLLEMKKILERYL